MTRSFALDEVIDDYEDEGYIQSKNNIIRNDSSSCMELDKGEGKIIEDYTIYTENDPNNRFTISDNMITYTNIARADDNHYVSYDKGVDNMGTFIHTLDFCVNSSSEASTGYYVVTIWGIMDELNDLYYFRLNYINMVALIVGCDITANKFFLILEERSPPSTYIFDSSIQLSEDVWYYVKIKRILNDKTYIGIYSTAQLRNNGNGENGDKDNLVTLTTNHSFRYIYAIQSYGLSDAVRYATGKVKNLCLTEYGYSINGYFYTKNLLNSVNGSTVVLLTNCTLNTGSINAEFSDNNMTWVDHNGAAGSDILVSGYESIDLRDIDFEDLYVRFNYTRGDFDKTPKLKQIRVITSGSPPSGESGFGTSEDYFIFLPVGIIFCMVIFLLVARRR